MSTADLQSVAITGLGAVTPLGNDLRHVLERIEARECAAAPPTRFNPEVFDCPVCAEVRDFAPGVYVSEPKMVRLMNRDAQLAVAAARLALRDAYVEPDGFYLSKDIALFGATGVSGLPLAEVMPLIRASAGKDGAFDLGRFGAAGLKAVSPTLSFKILGNMPLCFVSINERIRGLNSIYTPWEGQGAQAIEAGIRALHGGGARCALVGGCDVKTHELGFAILQQLGLFEAWQKTGAGLVPGEGAVFLLLELLESAVARRARIYARITRTSVRTHRRGASLAHARAETISRLKIWSRLGAVVSSADGDAEIEQQETAAIEAGHVTTDSVVCPKKQVGDLFAAAAPLQVGLAGLLAGRGGRAVLANCFGYGSQQAAFLLETA